MIPLETIRIASPCHADWDEMEGDAQARFCRTCRKNVYNLSEMTRAEAEALVTRTEGRLCVRFYTRADGTVLTQDCPVGLRAVRRRLVEKLSYAAAVLLSCSTGLLRWAGMAQAVTPAKKPVCTAAKSPGQTRTMGKIVRPNRLMGQIAKPPVMGKPVAPKPPTHPFGGGAMMRGMMPPPIMGAPEPAKKK